jgi:hypothetical protein
MEQNTVTQLIRYETARKALTDAVMFDEVMTIMNVAEQAALYAKQANDNELIEKATEIRVRAQRKAGEMLRQAAEQGHRATGSTGNPELQVSKPATLQQIGITRDQSSRYQQLAAMPDEHFETAVATAKATAGEVTTAFMLREAAKVQPRPPKGAKADAMRDELKAAAERDVSLLTTYARLTIKALRSMDSVTDQERIVLDELAEAIAAKAA